MWLVDNFRRCDGRYGRLPILDLQLFCAMCQVISRSSSNSDDFRKRVAPGLAGFGLNRIQNSITLAEDEVVKAPDDPGSAGEWYYFPNALGFPGTGYRAGNIG